LLSCNLKSLTNINSFYLIIVDGDDKVKDDNDDDDDNENDEQPRRNLKEPYTHDMLNNSSFRKHFFVILNLLSRAESTIFIATTINNQHFLQISAPLYKSEKNVNQSVTHLTTKWHQLLMRQIQCK